MPALVAAPKLTPTDVSSTASETGHETFHMTGEQAQEVAVFMDFMRAYNNRRLEEAMALLSEDIVGSDCDYRHVAVIVFRGKAEAATWLHQRFADADQLQVSRILNENPAASGEHAIEVEYARRSSTTLSALGFSDGITPKLATKVIFEPAPTRIGAFANGPYGGDPKECRPGD